MSNNKNAATESTETISAIEARLAGPLEIRMGNEEPPQIVKDARTLLEVVKALDEENNQLAQRVVIAEGAVAKVRQMQTAKSGKKQARIFRRLVTADAKDYAREHVDEDAKKFYDSMEQKLNKVRRRVIIALIAGQVFLFAFMLMLVDRFYKKIF